MKEGRELDARIAEEVMGWIPWLEKRGEYTHVVWQKDEMEPYRRSRNWESQVERYTKTTWSKIDGMKHVVPDFFKPGTQIADAWLVVEKMWNIGCWRVDIRRMDNGYLVDFDDMRDTYSASATAAPP